MCGWSCPTCSCLTPRLEMKLTAFLIVFVWTWESNNLWLKQALSSGIPGWTHFDLPYEKGCFFFRRFMSSWGWDECERHCQEIKHIPTKHNFQYWIEETLDIKAALRAPGSLDDDISWSFSGLVSKIQLWRTRKPSNWQIWPRKIFKNNNNNNKKLVDA